VQLLCGQCGNTLDLEDSKGGVTVDCWHCGRVLPAPLSNQEDFEAGLPDDFLEPEDIVGYALLVRNAMKRKIHVACGSCGRGLTVSFALAGKKARCPACKEQIRIPFPDEEGEDIEVRPAEAPETTELVAEPGRFQPAIALDDGEALANLAEAAAAAEAEPVPFEALARAAAEFEHDAYHGYGTAVEDENRDRLDLLAAWTAPPTAGVDALAQAELTEAASAAPAIARRQQLLKRKRVGVKGWMAVAAILAVAIVVGLVVAPMLLPKDSGPKVANPGRGKGGRNPKNKTPKPKPPKPKPKPPKPKPQPRPATCDVVAAWADPFAGQGYAPARPDRVYRKVTALVQAGDKKVSLKAYGSDVTLSVGGETYASLGSPASAGTLTMHPAQMTLDMKPRASRRVTFLFDLPASPASFGAAELSLQNIATIDVPAAAEPTSDIPATPTEFVEAPPRNLRPMLQHPVMAAVQDAFNQTLVLSNGNAVLKIAIPQASVSGTATETGPGSYTAVLQHEESTLACRLRLLNGGKRVILYLADEPFHEITYVQPGWREPSHEVVRPKPKPKTPKPPRKPKDPDTNPSKPKNGKKHMPDFDPNQKTIFDF
jgi:ribosomal protein S27E